MGTHGAYVLRWDLRGSYGEKRRNSGKYLQLFLFPFLSSISFFLDFVGRGIGVAECCLYLGQPWSWCYWPEESYTWKRQGNNNWGFHGWKEVEWSIICTSDNVMNVSERKTNMIARIDGIFKQLGYKPSYSLGANFFTKSENMTWKKSCPKNTSSTSWCKTVVKYNSFFSRLLYSPSK